MKKIALIAAVAAFPAITFAGGSGSDLSQYTSSTARILNFDPSVSAERVQSQVGAIGSVTDLNEARMLQTDVTTVTTPVAAPTRTFRTRRVLTTQTLDEGEDVNRAARNSSQEIVSEREEEARKKLLRYRSLGY